MDGCGCPVERHCILNPGEQIRVLGGTWGRLYGGWSVRRRGWIVG